MGGNWNSGRRPAPNAMKVLRGQSVRRTIELVPPAATESFDDPPEEIADDAIASKEWRRVAPTLRLCGLVSETDRSALLACCQQWSDYQTAQRQVRVLGMIVVDAKGIPRTNPYVIAATRALTLCHRLWTELGLTPIGRARMAEKVPPRTPPTGPATVPGSKWDGLL